MYGPLTRRSSPFHRGRSVLNRTYFYPTGGGQLHDEGVLHGAGVGDVAVLQVTKSGPAVLHRIGRSSTGASRFEIGETLRGTIDWERRYRHMRLHTAQHLLSALLFERADVRTRRANLAGVHATLDLEAPIPDGDLWTRLATEMNDHQRRGRAVRVTYLPRAEFDAHPSARSGLVPLPPQVDPVRVIGIEGIDTCPCGGTHLQNTVEIGRVQLTTPTPQSSGSNRVVLTLDASTPIPSA